MTSVFKEIKMLLRNTHYILSSSSLLLCVLQILSYAISFVPQHFTDFQLKEIQKSPPPLGYK